MCSLLIMTKLPTIIDKNPFCLRFGLGRWVGGRGRVKHKQSKKILSSTDQIRYHWLGYRYYSHLHQNFDILDFLWISNKWEEFKGNSNLWPLSIKCSTVLCTFKKTKFFGRACVCVRAYMHAHDWMAIVWNIYLKVWYHITMFTIKSRIFFLSLKMIHTLLHVFCYPHSHVYHLKIKAALIWQKLPRQVT